MREDALQLFGFSTEEERELFRLFLGVSKIGPKLALAALSVPAAGRSASGRWPRVTWPCFSSVPGIGKKTAERLILELRRRWATSASPAGAGGRRRSAGDDGPLPLARAALLELGFASAGGRQAAGRALDPDQPVEGIVRQALGRQRPERETAREVGERQSDDDERLADPEEAPSGAGAGDAPCVRARWARSWGSRCCASSCRSSSRRPSRAASRWTTCCWPVLPGWARPRWPTSSPLEMGVNIVTTSGPALERKADMAAILTHLQEGDVLFIDEIHRLNRSIEEILYPAMEDFEIDIVIGQGPERPHHPAGAAPLHAHRGHHALGAHHHAAARPLRLLPPARLLLGGRPGAASSRGRPRSWGWASTRRARSELALRSRGTPRIANRLLRRVRDFAQVRHEGDITGDIALEALRLFEVDDEGLDRVDREILNLILHKFDGGPVGLSTLAVAIGEEADTIEDVYEPFLLQRGFLMRTPRGRVLTRLGYEHCGVTPPAAAQPASARHAVRLGRRQAAVTSMKLLLHICCGPCATRDHPPVDRAGRRGHRLLLQPQHPPAAGVAPAADRRRARWRRRPASRCSMDDRAYDPAGLVRARCVGDAARRLALRGAASASGSTRDRPGGGRPGLRRLLHHPVHQPLAGPRRHPARRAGGRRAARGGVPLRGPAAALRRIPPPDAGSGASTGRSTAAAWCPNGSATVAPATGGR